MKFNIINYSKPDSLFNYGMKISVYSEKKAEQHGIGWHKDGSDISYFMNGIRKDVNYCSKFYYTLTFTYTFEHDLDVVFFSYSTPYSYSDLRNDIEVLESSEDRSPFISKKLLCKTLGGEDCDILTITSRENLDSFASRKCS